jgi:hypothetical protein
MRVQRALLAHLIAKLSPARVTVVDTVVKPWASITFTGARFEFTLLVEGEAATDAALRLKQTIGCSEFSIPGHLVADIIVANMNSDSAGVRLDIEVLTVADD